MPAPYVIFSLPRSRSTWLSVFLSRPGALCGHDLGMTIASPDEFTTRLRGEYAGTCETGASFAWRLIRQQMPEARFAVVLRDPAEVVTSLARCGVIGVAQEIEARWNELVELSVQPGVLTLGFDDLNREAFCAELYRHCLGEAPPKGWWAHLDPVNIQVDMGRNLAALAARAAPIAALKADVRRLMAHG